LIVAGTTATLAAISLNPSGTSELTVLNCGDSRTILVGEVKQGSEETSVVAFETRDHSPDDELEIQRLKRGMDAGLDYSIPECSMSQSYLRVGDFQYAVCRSLEGAYVTSKGIVSEPDITTLQLSEIVEARQHCALVLSCDGLFEVMSNEEVGLEVVRMRKEGYKAGEIAKNLCGQALKKGSYDNISTIVVYLDSA
jgi:serine/threonine protein phosphatase PrpC